jgi:uncharacterized membrane protein
MSYRRSASSTVVIQAPAHQVFALLDDPNALGRHMDKRSIMMLGSSMAYELDDPGGRRVGSVIKMRGSILGIGLRLEEVVTERLPPLRKVWETRGPVRLLVIGHYRMGFTIEPNQGSCTLTVVIEYNLPDGIVGKLLGRMLGDIYADWCVRQITNDALRRSSSMPRPIN